MIEPRCKIRVTPMVPMEDEDEEDEVEDEDEDEEDEVEDEVAAGYTWTLTSHPPLLATWLLSCS